MYTPVVPNQPGLTHLNDISLEEVIPFMQWKFFFHAWRMNGKYDGIETVCECISCRTAWLQNFSQEERPKAEEALKLFRDAQEALRLFLKEQKICINASFALYPARSGNDTLFIQTEKEEIAIPVLRQQRPSTDGFCYSLADFIAPKDDFIGMFAVTVIGAESMAAEYEKNDDLYHAILIRTLADRLAEASAEWLHYKVRTQYWGYSPDEELDIKSILKGEYTGIRPAVGYPSLPDQSVIFDVAPILELEKTGISITENGAMYPTASICGFYFAHPQAKYFQIGKIDERQLTEYATLRNRPVDEMKKWLVGNI